MTPPLPTPVDAKLPDGDLRSYWWARVEQHLTDSYAGVPMQKFPEDLRVYEHLLWASRVDTVIEIGTYRGGSALWFRDRLRALRAYRRAELPAHVVTIDIDQSGPRIDLEAADPEFAREIDLVEADIADPGLPDRIDSMLRPGARCIVIEDSAHIAETTRAALEGFARFVRLGDFLVVEDGFVDIDELRLPRHLIPPGVDLPRGVLTALDEWLATPEGARFEVRRDLEIYGISSHPRGYLRRVSGMPLRQKIR